MFVGEGTSGQSDFYNLMPDGKKPGKIIAGPIISANLFVSYRKFLNSYDNGCE